MKMILFQQYVRILISIFVVFPCVGHTKDLDVLILTPQMDQSGSRVRTGFDTTKMSLYLDAMLKATPSFAGSSCVAHTDVDVDSLLELHYDTRYRATTAAEIKNDYDVVVMVPYYPYLRWAPELCFEGVMQMSSAILEAGARPIFLMSVGDGNGDSGPVGRNARRVANGCGIEVNPAGYALLDQGLFVKSLGEQQAYIMAASLYAQITGLSAGDLDYAPVADHETLAAAAFTNLQTQAHGDHYTGARKNSNMVRYRTIDVSAAPLNGTVRYAYVGTSTEAGINSHLQAIIQANGWTAAPQFISSNGGGSKYWTDTDFDLAKPYYEADDDQFLFAYARGTTSDATQMVNYDQANLLPMTFDRHRDNIGSGAGSSLEMLEDIEVGSWYDYWYHRSKRWNAVPFHIGASRLYHSDNSLVVSSDGVHLTTPFYNLVASMMLTSALGQDLQPSSAIQNNAQSLAAFNTGQLVVKQLAYLSEDSHYMPDSQLKVSTETFKIATLNHAYSQIVAATGGTAPYSWEVVSSAGLPAGLTLSEAGVLSGTPTTGTGAHVVVCKVTDSNGAIRKRALKLLVLDGSATSYTDWADYMFDDSGVAASEQDQNDDPDGDGRSNFLEFATADDPVEPTTTSTRFISNAGTKSFQFSRGQAHLKYTVESSPNLIDWDDIEWDSLTHAASLVALGDTQEIELDVVRKDAVFYRLKVSE